MTINPLSPTNDPVLRPLLDAPDEAERQRALEAVLVERARPVISGVLGTTRGTSLGRDEADDIAATVTLRLVRRLRRVADGEAPAIGSFGDFVARLTYNALYDFLRTRFPERTRLKNRLRYVARNDGRFVTTLLDGNAVVALAAWGHRGDVARRPSIPKHDAPAPMLRQHDTAGALAAALMRIGIPAMLDDLVTIFAEAWGISDHAAAESEPETKSDPEQELAMRSHLAALWKEIGALPPKQRSALLLNLRDREGLNAITLFVLVGVAGIAEIAEAAGLTLERMWTIWDDLPLDDLTIAGMLGLTRQQVINLRKSARERLARRMRQ
jgi:DNA-directed RNA polymerase specialized sigma24 family protein